MAYTVRGPLTELTLARIRELTREPEAVFWVFVFPILLTAILGLAFRSRPPEALPVAVVAGPHADAHLAALSKESDLKPSVLPDAEARQALARGRVVLVVSADDTPVYAYDPTQPESRAARLAVDAALQRAAGRADAFTAGRRAADGAGRALRGLPRAGPARHEPDGHRHVGHRLLAGGRAQRQPAEAAGGRARTAKPSARARSSPRA